MKKKILGGIGVIVLAAVCICGFFLSGAGSKYYYTQIDNSFLELMEPDGGVIDFSGGMDLKYTLLSYDENGKGRDISFGTTRELKEDAFLCLTVMPVRGVVEWREIQYEELPEAVRNQYDMTE